ncbi:uncharacterized protein LOC132612660 [Lycium barbarum]|uniref:uncharacterized protein LOC132612660 n=1 Tax=Lycium barbarum TaxID=112863 RepID=UPI00293F6D66|nr:uncharacterized protein LOC132612660 [Lycium barbarum]
MENLDDLHALESGEDQMQTEADSLANAKGDLEVADNQTDQTLSISSISINDNGIGSFPPEREELHDVISHNINVRAEVEHDEGKNKFKESEEEVSVEQVFSTMVKEAGISPRSRQKGSKKGKKQGFRRRLGMRYAHYNCNGKIWFFVNDNVDVEILQDLEQQITIKLLFQDWNKSLMVTMVYAKCDHLERISLWDSLYSLADQMELPWLVGGDFNNIMNEDEKIGGLPVSPDEYEDFEFCINSCELTDSDHAPLLLTWGESSQHIRKPFRFLKFWTEHASFLEVVNQAWITDFEGDDFIKFKLKLKNVKSALSAWSKATFGDIFKQLTVREEVVRIKEQCFEEDPTLMNGMVLQQAQAALKKYVHYEEEFWRQKSHMASFAEGDRNTRFYQQQFSQEVDPLNFELQQHVPSMVDQDTNNQLVSMPTLEEVKKAVFELSADSAGGPDDMIRIFYQVCWDIVGADVYNLVKAFFDGQTLPKSVTHTNLVLLPKKNNIETFADMRPINLSNFINKVISRVVQDKLEGILPSLISPNQSGFFKGRCIIENVLLTQEVMTDIRLRGKPANVVLKLDMAKAYDRVSRSYLIRVLRKMGFAEIFIDMVWRLIANNWYSILLNGQAYGFFHSTRDVKQGDPLSLALFILSAEVLSRALNSLFENNEFRSYGMPKRSANLNHLAYADDTIIFSSADARSLELIMEVLHAYEQNNSEEGRRRHWSSRLNLCKPKEERGVGFRSLFDVSKALCAKLWWKFRTTNTLWENYIWIKYCKRHSPQTVQWKGGSQVWKAMIEARDNIEQEIWWEPRSGTANVWFDNWTKLGALYHIIPDDFVIDEGVQDVKELMLQDGWNIGRLQQLFPMDIVDHILEELHFHEPTEEWDRPRWMMTASGKFTIGTAWELLRSKAVKSDVFKNIWTSGVPFKISFFFWRQYETVDHFFVTGNVATKVWTYVKTVVGITTQFQQVRQILQVWWNADCPQSSEPSLKLFQWSLCGRYGSGGIQSYMEGGCPSTK